MSAREQLLDRIARVLVCPTCRAGLDLHSASPSGDAARPSGAEPFDRELACPTHGPAARRERGTFHFQGLTDDAQDADWLNKVKAAAKYRLGRYYTTAIDVLGPVYGESGIPGFLATFGPDALVCDLGSGTRTYGDHVIAVDGYPYDNVHVVCDLARLPFADGSLDGVVSQAVLEHVPDPAAHVAEMFRVLKPGGRVHCFYPFMQAFHASPEDYSRLTVTGLRHLFSAFTGCETRVAGGPTSGLLWTLQEWLAIAGSFGSERLYRAIVPLTWVLSPLKYIDRILIKHPSAHMIASGFVIVGTKPGARA